MRASVGVGIFAPTANLSKIRFKNVLGSAGVVFNRHLKPNLAIGGGLAVNSSLGYPMLFPAVYLNWKREGNFDLKVELIDGLDVSALYPKFHQYFREYQPKLLLVWGNRDAYFCQPEQKHIRRIYPM